MRTLAVIAVILVVLFLVDLLGALFLGNVLYLLLIVPVILLLVHFIRRV